MAVVITLGGVNLPKALHWPDRYAFSPAKHSVKRTLGGGRVVFHSGLVFGRPITLVGSEENGWLTKAQADALQSMSDAPGVVYNLAIGAESFSVMFRHEEPPALSLRPLIPRLVPVEGDLFVGEIRLVTV